MISLSLLADLLTCNGTSTTNMTVATIHYLFDCHLTIALDPISSYKKMYVVDDTCMVNT
jgi:hypothetical protein